MKITFNWYNANRWLPEPKWLFQAVRRIDFLMKADPNKNWNKIKEWCRPMCQLNPGLFFNITDVDPKKVEEMIGFDGEASEEVKLTMTWIDAGYIRVQFEVDGKNSLFTVKVLTNTILDPMPYKITNCKSQLRSG